MCTYVNAISTLEVSLMLSRAFEEYKFLCFNKTFCFDAEAVRTN